MLNLGLDQMPTCVFCRVGKRLKDSISCKPCRDFVDMRQYLDVQMFRYAALLTASHLGFKGDFAREIARDVEKQRVELWGKAGVGDD